MVIHSLCHTFGRLVPVGKYFAQHPEYYSLVHGKRQKDKPQLCCTNPDVIRICTEAVRKQMREHSEATVFSVSQDDWDNYCRCSNCQAVAERENSQMGPVLQLVNHVAEGVEKEFPDKIVQTLAYQWTRRPPKHIRPRPNVVIMLCSVKCCFSHPLATCDSPQNQDFLTDLEEWAKIAPRLWVWDYTTNFHHFLLPFPNQRVLGPNIQFFVAHNVKGIFEEDTPYTCDSELAALGGYVTAKCLWNPKYDTALARREFLEAYYGPAATAVNEYLNLLHDHVERENLHVSVFDPLNANYLNDNLLLESNALWERAEELVAGTPDVLKRVRTSRMSVDYALLERARLQKRGKLPLNKQAMSAAVARFKPFFDALQDSKLTRLKESGKPLDKTAYREELAKDLHLQP